MRRPGLLSSAMLTPVLPLIRIVSCGGYSRDGGGIGHWLDIEQRSRACLVWSESPEEESDAVPRSVRGGYVRAVSCWSPLCEGRGGAGVAYDGG